MPIELKKIKCGQAFVFYQDDLSRVWVKCRGGFRSGRGGQLHSCSANTLVVLYGAP